jgi:hypothetical protein
MNEMIAVFTVGLTLNINMVKGREGSFVALCLACSRRVGFTQHANMKNILNSLPRVCCGQSQHQRILDIFSTSRSDQERLM